MKGSFGKKRRDGALWLHRGHEWTILMPMMVRFHINAQRSASCDGLHNVYKWPNFWSMLMNSSSCWFLGICALLTWRFRLFSAFFYRTDSISSEQLRSQIICYLWVISLAQPFGIIRKYEIHIWYTGTFLWSSNSDFQIAISKIAIWNSVRSLTFDHDFGQPV